MDIPADILTSDEGVLRLNTQHGGCFTFSPILSVEAIAAPLQRVMDAQNRFRSTPLHQVANDLEREVVVRSVFGTNTIEGGELDEDETAKAINLDPEQVEQEQQRRVLNIKLAYDMARQASNAQDWHPDLTFIKGIHCQIADRLKDEDYRPGVLRDNDKHMPTRVGDAAHGGVYKPPQYGQDIALLLQTLVEWHQRLARAGVPALIRAPLFHLYFELIHPFYNGNGRVGRVVEASILLADGFQYAPFAQANYYLEKIDAYFTLFNTCRKKKDNTPFVTFFLEGMLQTINRLHDRVNRMVELLLFRNHLRALLETRTINERQYAIVLAVLEAEMPLTVTELRAMAWYKAMYQKLTDKTQRRDLQKLKELTLIRQMQNDQLWPGFLHPDKDGRI